MASPQKVSQIILIVLFGAAIIYAGGDYLWKKYKISSSGKIIDQPDAIIYLPHTLQKETLHPLIVSFSPAGNADVMIELWQPLADKYKLIVYASKIYKNNTPMDLPVIKNYIDQAANTFPVDKSKIIYTGLSGGGSFSHTMNLAYPELAYGVIINTGKFWELDDKPEQIVRYYKGARNKIGFIASPTDFRYKEMQRDYYWMKEWGFAVNWIEFEGGHRYAPREMYDKTLAWIFSSESNVVKPQPMQSSKLNARPSQTVQPQTAPAKPRNVDTSPYSYR